MFVSVVAQTLMFKYPDMSCDVMKCPCHYCNSQFSSIWVDLAVKDQQTLLRDLHRRLGDYQPKAWQKKTAVTGRKFRLSVLES
jgi:hypothetical protein